MTKATTSRPANAGAQPEINAKTTGTKAKRPRGKAAPASAAGTGLAETPTSATNALSHPRPPRQTKAALLRARLAEPGGVSLAALIEATGWQAHTLRAYLSGLRKEGLTLTRRREGEDTIYAIDPSGFAAGKTTDEGAAKETASEAPREAMTEDVVAGAADAAEASLSAESNA